MYASCFSIMELGANASGMGGAFVAIADDGSALYYNPAGIAFQDGTRFESDAFIVKGKFRFDPSSTPPGTVVPQAVITGLFLPAISIPGESCIFTHSAKPQLHRRARCIRSIRPRRQLDELW